MLCCAVRCAIAAALFALASVATLDTLRAGQMTDPVLDLHQHVARVTGPDALDCGRHLLVRSEGRWVAADETALRKSVECGLEAVSAKRTFWTFVQHQGIDSWLANGIAGTSQGVIYRFSYDSAPCGGPGCASRITFERCDRPAVATAPHVGVQFQCSRPAPR